MKDFSHIKKLGFGYMRLPQLPDKQIDLEETNKMVDKFMQSGFNYFDTAYVYFNGLSEEALRKTLVERYPRDSFLVASKLPAWAGAKTKEDAEQMFWTSMKRMGVEYFDFYLLHNLGGKRTQVFDNFDIWNFLKKKKEEGYIKNLGFSLHDDADALEKLLTEHPDMDFVQLQINYQDWEDENVQSRKCYEVARAHNMPIIIMEPVKGGALANMPERVAKIFKAESDKSLSSWALRYCASLEGVVTVLSGMSNMAQMDDNLDTFMDFKPISDAEMKTIDKAKAEIDQIPKIQCTQCGYCTKDCPKGIAIPQLLNAMNVYTVYNDLTGAKTFYTWATGTGNHASTCIECGKCEEVCPQKLHVINSLKEIAETIEE